MERGRHYCHQVIPSVELGGGDLVGLELAANLRERGQTAPVWVPAQGPTRERACEMGLEPGSFGGPALSRPGLLRPLLTQWRFGRRLRRQSPGLVHVHSALCYGTLSWGLSRCGLARVVHVQIEVDDDGLRWALKRPPELIVTCARFLVERVRGCLAENVRDSQWIEELPNTVDTDRFFPADRQQAKAKVGAPPLPLVLMLANLAPHKGQETAVRAIAELKRRGIDVACWLAGEERGGGNAFTARLRGLIAELGVGSQVWLPGFRSDAPALLQAADFFLLPSTHEGLPLTVLEAQATRVPVLASATAGIPEAVQDGETGFLIAADNAIGYADVIARLLRDEALRQRVTEQAFARTTRVYNRRVFWDRIWDLYQVLMSRQQGRPRRAGHPGPAPAVSSPP